MKKENIEIANNKTVMNFLNVSPPLSQNSA